MAVLEMLVAALHLGLIGPADALRAAYQIPPWDFMLTCESINTSSDFYLDTEVQGSGSNQKEDHDITGSVSYSSPAEIPASLGSGTDFLCSFWSDTTLNGSLNTDGADLRGDSPSAHASVYRQHGLQWHMCCWLRGRMDMLICSLNTSYENPSMDTNFGVKLFYTRSNVSIEDDSIVEEANFKNAPCFCIGPEWCECSIPLAELNSFDMWVEITNGMLHIQSPEMAVNSLDIVKPNPPVNLRADLTDTGELKLCWSQPTPTPYELQYEVKHSGTWPENRWQFVETGKENCLILGTVQPDSALVVQVRGKRLQGPGFWSDWSRPLEFPSEDVMYFPKKILARAGSNASFYCLYNKDTSSKALVWWLNLAEKIPEQQYTVINNNIGKVTLLNLNSTKTKGQFPFAALYCCHNNVCDQLYAEIYVIDVNISISCETNGKITKMTCSWPKDELRLPGKSHLQLKYYRSSIYCPDQPNTRNTSDSKDCWLQKNGLYECTFQPIYPVWAYIMWIEITHDLGTLESTPICVMPMDVVKAEPPSNVHAEIAVDIRLFNVSWKRPSLPVDGLCFQIRYSADPEQGIWQTMDVYNSESVRLHVPDLCVAYTVQVRCRRLNGSGYWSEWSEPALSTVKDIQAPVKGPDFWRTVWEDPITKEKNITLLWQPLMKSYSLCSVRGYTVKHHTSNNGTWSDYVGNDTQYTFSWTDPVHTVTVLANNSLGASLRNFNLTFSQQMSTVDIVESLKVYRINNSCAAFFWRITPGVQGPILFVFEWEILRQEEKIKWIHVPSNTDRYYVNDYFVAFEKYRFRLYPILPEGTGKPYTMEGFSKDENQMQNDIGMFVILPIIVLSSFLLVAALLISHHRMKKMFWEDVPNPKNCSWAQGVNFEQPETLEHLFIKHHETLAFEPPLLTEQEISIENISVNKQIKSHPSTDQLAIHCTSEKIDDSDQDSACASLDKSYQESATESIKYSVIVANSQSGGLYERSDCDISKLTSGYRFGTNSPGKDSSRFCKASPCSTVSSEGFSEPSDTDENFLEGSSPERGCYYLGITSTIHDQNWYSEDSKAVYPLQSHVAYSKIAFLQDTSSGLHPFGDYGSKDILDDDDALSESDFLPYMPQYQTSVSETLKAIEI